MSAAPLVSVVLATYNQQEYVQQALASVFAQSCTDWELVVVDNGSSDATQSLLQEHAGDPRVSLILHDSNAAVTSRLNEAIGRTKGEFVSILYGDDYYLPRKLERQLEIFRTLPPSVGVVHGPGFRLNDRTRAQWFVDAVHTGADALADLLRGRRNGYINPIAPLFRRVCWERHPFHEDVFVEGESVYLRYALSAGFHYEPEPLVVMRDHDNNMGKATQINFPIALGLLERLAAEPGFPRSHRQHVAFARADLMCAVGWELIRITDDSARGGRLLLAGIRAHWPHAFRARTAIGLVLAFAPAPLRRALNRSATALLDRPGNQVIIDSWQASDAKVRASGPAKP